MNPIEMGLLPVADYTPPRLPTLQEKPTALLKKLPSRWQQHAKVLACVGAVGVIGFSSAFALGVTPVHAQEPLVGVTQGYEATYAEGDLVVRFHTGGMGVSFYVVHLTEQEAFGLIRTRLEAAGLSFGALPPVDLLTEWESTWWGSRVPLELFNAQHRVAVAPLTWLQSNTPFSSWERDFAMEIEGEASQMMAAQDAKLGVFYMSGRRFFGNFFEGIRPQRPTPEVAQAARPYIEARLNEQIDMFIAYLQTQGVLEHSTEINVAIDGTPLATEAVPVMVNGRVMVPSQAIFDALGLQVTIEQGHGWQDLNASNGQYAIHITFGSSRHHWHVNEETVAVDTPAYLFGDGTMLFPLRQLAEAVGATVTWDADTHTVHITTQD